MKTLVTRLGYGGGVGGEDNPPSEASAFTRLIFSSFVPNVNRFIQRISLTPRRASVEERGIRLEVCNQSCTAVTYAFLVELDQANVLHLYGYAFLSSSV